MILPARAPRRHRADADVPTINLVFLLLVFFLLTATLAPPDPLGVEPPEGEGDGLARGTELVVAADGTPALGELRGEPAWAALAMREPGPLVLRADASLPGETLGALLPRLRDAGATRIDLVLAPR